MNRRRRFAIVLTISALGSSLLGPAKAGEPSDTLTLGGIECDLIPTRVGGELALPVGALVPCPGVRPGATVRSPSGQCTFNFMWRDQSGIRYMGTAGHCVINGGEQTWAFGSGPVARNAQGQRVGEFVYAVLQSPKDFALVRLDTQVAASAQMCHFGGPTGQNDDLVGGPVVLHHFGQGIGLGPTVPGRTAVAKSMPHPDHVFADGVAIFGDSGSGVISADGRAVGVVVTIGVHLNGFFDNGVVGITRLKPQVQRAQQMLGVSLTLQEGALL